MPYLIYFIVCLFVVCCDFGSSEETWRYSVSRVDDSRSDFTTKHSISVEYFGVKDVQWCHSHGCTINQSSLSVTTLRCQEAGFHAISPVGNGSLVRHLEVKYSPFCYEWNHALERNTSPSTLRLWITDDLHASQDELQDTAAVPSLFSGRLTKTFHKLGQEPSVHLTSGYRYVDEPQAYHNSSFNKELSCWEYRDFAFSHQSALWISGKSVALHDCFVRSKAVELKHAKPALLIEPASNKIKLQGDGKAARIIKDPCASHIAVLISSELKITQDNFRTTSSLYVLQDLLQGEPPIVQDVTFSSEYLVVLLQSGLVLSISAVTPDTAILSSGMSGVTISHLSKRSSCVERKSGQQKAPDVIVAWTNEGGVPRVYITDNNMTQFALLDVPWPSTASDWILHDVVINSFFHDTFFLIRKPSSAQPLLLELKADGNQTWKEHTLPFALFSPGSSLKIAFHPPSSHFVVVWSETSAFYGAINGDGRELVVKHQDSAIAMPTGNNTIKTVATVESGGFILHLSNNKMFYGRIGVQYIVEVHPGELSSTDMAAMFDLIGGLLLVKNESFDGSLSRRYLPLKNEAMSAVYPDTECPYIKFWTSIPRELTYIDKGQSLTGWVALLYRKIAQIDITHHIFGSGNLDLIMGESIEYFSHRVLRNKTFTFREKRYWEDNGTDSEDISGPLSVTFRPEKIGLTCRDPCQETLLLQVGCPPIRHIRIRNCSMPAKPDNVTDIVAYYKDQVQCTLSVGVDTKLRLKVDMYDDKHIVHEVVQDYVLEERDLKTGYGYTATMNQVGCKREAQTWASLSEKNMTWDQNSHKTCFIDDGNPVSFDGSKAYEVLNSSGTNHVVFSKPGLYQFTLTVIDPSLSFCSLSAQFLVEVAPGEEKKQFLAEAICMAVVALLSFVLLCFSFLLYRKETLGEHEQDRQVAERLQQLRTIYNGARTSLATEVVARRSTARSRHSIRRASGTAELLGLGPRPSSSSKCHENICPTDEDHRRRRSRGRIDIRET
ncbi:cation channel sperm-associated auxiliary subunit epsilon [Nematostella vectensis]|uniref:cation channel sperm-associated auxiliary subunit epsilon n=1 Tax=Nematostella vectensis TaxID=45351 RepID=UPI00138FF359|nr:cation channel sperm-associated auxiliary subunit epsilon [Nematostella vectensis]